MKTKAFFRGAMIVLSAFVMTCWMSCRPVNQPSDPSKPTEPDHSPKTARMQYAFATNDEMVDLFYIRIDYLDENGKTQTVTLNESTWSLSVQSKALPAKFGMKVNITMRGMADLTKYDVVPINYGWSYVTTALDSDGLSVGDVHRNAGDVEMDVSPIKVSTWLEEYAKHPIEFSVEYDADGKFK